MTADAFTPPPDAVLPLRLLPHALRPVPLLAQEMLERFLGAFGGNAIHVNGYSYLTSGGGAPPAALDPCPYEGGRDAWEQHALPRIREICDALWSEDYERWSPEELAQALPGYFAEAARAFAYTMQPLPLAIAPAHALLAFCEERFGPGGDRLLAAPPAGLRERLAGARAGHGGARAPPPRVPRVARRDPCWRPRCGPRSAGRKGVRRGVRRLPGDLRPRLADLVGAARACLGRGARPSRYACSRATPRTPPVAPPPPMRAPAMNASRRSRAARRTCRTRPPARASARSSRAPRTTST